MLLETLGIYGWSQDQENLLLASLLTGDPLLLVGPHGCAKTYLASRLAEALGAPFVAYDASKALFEDVLGYLNPGALKRGVMEYVPGLLTISDKEMVLIDELNQALPELQSKWLEVIRSRRIMGLHTLLRWVWAAMNPSSYTGTQTLDPALVGRFALYVYPPQALEMGEVARVTRTRATSQDDAPALDGWLGEGVRGEDRAVQGVGDVPACTVPLAQVLGTAARHFQSLREDLTQLPLFLSRLAELLKTETGGRISLDGRRLGYLYRNILSHRAVEIAVAQLDGGFSLSPLVDSVRRILHASLPLGLDEELIRLEEARHQLELCCDLLSDFFRSGSELSRLDVLYELCTTHDLRRKAEILLQEELGELVRCRGWQQLVEGEADITPLAYVTLQVEAHRPGTVPAEMLRGLSQRIKPQALSTRDLPPLKDDAIEHLDEIEGLLTSAHSDLERVVALERVRELCQGSQLDEAAVRRTRERIRQDLAWMEELMGEGGPTTGIPNPKVQEPTVGRRTT